MDVKNVGSEVKLAGNGEFNVTSHSLASVIASSGGKATVTNAYIGGACASLNSTITVSGNVTGNNIMGILTVYAQYNSTITVSGNVTSTDGYGVYAQHNSTVTVYGNVSVNVITNSLIASVGADNSNVTVYGEITLKVQGGADMVSSGVSAKNCSFVEIKGNVTATRIDGILNATDGVSANSGSKVSVTGDVTGDRLGVGASGSDTNVLITGDLTGGSQGSVFAYDGAQVTVTGGVTEGNIDANSAKVSVTGDVTGTVSAYFNSATVIVTGDVTGSVITSENATVTVTGDVIGGGVSSNGNNSIINVYGSVTCNNYGYAVRIFNGGVITIVGDVISDDRGVSFGGNSNAKSEVTIDGQITVKEPQAYGYIMIYYENHNYLAFSYTDYQPTSRKPGYLEYTDGTNYVWVKKTGTGMEIIPQPSSTLKAYIQNGHLHLSGLTVGDLWTVYNLSGAIAYQSRATTKESDIYLSTKGVYIIVSAGQRLKASNF